MRIDTPVTLHVEVHKPSQVFLFRFSSIVVPQVEHLFASPKMLGDFAGVGTSLP